jgi:hypothetical protein
MEGKEMKKILSVLRKTPRWQRCSRATAAGLCLLLVLALVPQKANAGVGDIIAILTSIYSTLRGSIGGTLTTIQGVNANIRDLHQQVVWPVSVINQTRGFVGQVTAQYRDPMWQIHTLANNSARLANASQLESVFRSRQAGSLPQLGPVFQRLYQSVPTANDAPIAERNMMDMDDASALSAFKTSVVSDQSGNQMLVLADQMEQQAAQAAPGSTPLLAAQAQIANLESQAFLQRMLASELRQEAAKLAHDNAARKRSAAATRSLRDQVHEILSRP